MAASVVQSKKVYFSGADTSATAFDSNVTAGNSIVVVVAGYHSSASATVVSDSRSSTYTRQVNERYATDNFQALEIFTAPNITGGACTVTVNPPNSSCWVSYVMIEVGGLDAASFDVANSAEDAGAGTSGNSGSVTPTQTGDILIGAIETLQASGTVTITQEADYTLLQEYEDASSYIPVNVSYRVYNSTSADTANWTFGSSVEWLGGIVALKASGSSPVTVSLNAATISASPQAITPAPGAASVSLNAVTLTAAAQTVTPGTGAAPQTVILGAATLSAAAQAATIVPGAASVSINAATISAAAQTVTASVEANTITMTSPTNYQAFKRNIAAKTGSISISGTYTGAPTAIEARFNGGAWATIDNTLSGGTFSGTLSGQAQGQGTLEVRFTNDTGVTDSATYVTITDVFALWGQSNNVGPLPSNQSWSHATLKPVLFRPNQTWIELADPVDLSTDQVYSVAADAGAAGSWIPAFCTKYMSMTGLAPAFIPCALSGSYMSWWQPPTNHYDTTELYGAGISEIAAAGSGCTAVLWWQGESDMIAATTRAQYNSWLDTVANDLNSDLGVPLMACTIESVDNWGGGISQANQDAINNAIEDAWADNSNVLTGPAFRDHEWESPQDGQAHFASSNDVTYIVDGWYNAIAAEILNQTITLNAGTITASPQAITLDAGAGNVTVSLNAATLSAAAQTITPAPGAVSVSLGAAAITAGPQSVTNAPGAVAVALGAAAISAEAQSLTVVPGAVSVILSAATITADAQTITPSLGGSPQTVSLGAATISAGAQAITAAPGAVAVALNSAEISAVAQAVTVSAPEPGSVVVTLSAATITASPQAITSVPGAVAVSLSAAEIAAQAQLISISSETIVSLSTATITASPQSATITPGAVAIILAAVGLGSQAGSISVSGGAQIASLVFALDKRAITFVIKQRSIVFTQEE